MLSRRDCPILWMIPCYLYELPPSRYLICFLCGLCDVSGQCLLPSPPAPVLGVCARGSLWLSRAAVPCGSCVWAQGLWWLPSAWLLLFPIVSAADRDWMRSVPSTWVSLATHGSSFFQDFSFLTTKALYSFSFLSFLPPFTAVFIAPSSGTAGML